MKIETIGKAISYIKSPYIYKNETMKWQEFGNLEDLPKDLQLNCTGWVEALALAEDEY